MSYTTAKANFEAAVKSMQAELQRYIASGKANQRAVDIKTSIINKLVEYYEEAEKEISEQQMRNMELELNFNKLHRDTSKLFIFSKLHCINPELVFHYSLTELQRMLLNGMKIRQPTESFYKIKVTEVKKIGQFEYPVIELEPLEADDTETSKYQYLNQLYSKRK